MNGLCECGCGEKAPISRFTSVKQGYVKGQARRFVYGHHARLQPKQDPEERFRAKFVIDPAAGCWLWQGRLAKGGYGIFYTGEKKDGDHRRSVNVFAHRWSFQHFVGVIPMDLFVCHSCDNPPCVNPDHLWLGTAADNMADMVAKGRSAKAPLSPEHRAAIGRGSREMWRKRKAAVA